MICDYKIQILKRKVSSSLAGDKTILIKRQVDVTTFVKIPINKWQTFSLDHEDKQKECFLDM